MRAPPRQHDALHERVFVRIPPPGFDPLSASPRELARYDIVPRPDARRHPGLFQQWLPIFAPPVSFVDARPEPRLEEESGEVGQNSLRMTRRQSGAGGGSRYEASQNWSGAFVVPADDRMFVLVAGMWTIPDLMPPPVEFRKKQAKAYVCSTWVGLDGQRLYLDSSLPQAGTMQVLPASPARPAWAIAFFQWWNRQTGGGFAELKGLPVQPGDVVLSAVWAKSDTTTIAYLRNISTGQMTIVGATAPVVPFRKIPKVELKISGATAEWVLERPSIPGTNRYYPFPAYSTTTFTCWAGAARKAGPPETWHDLRTARLIRMFDRLRQPSRTVYTSMPERRGDVAVRLSYGDFKD